MRTEILPADPASIARAANVLRGGGLVAFPTETVYGLGANALDATAVGRIFAAKGRPVNNPIIVHVAGSAQVAEVAVDWPEIAAKLADQFWPGPLTLILPKRPEVPDSVTAGGPTVGVRVPAHPAALALLRAAGLPKESRIEEALAIVRARRQDDGRWPLDVRHRDTLYQDIAGAVGEPNRWITLRALRVLRWFDGDSR